MNLKVILAFDIIFSIHNKKLSCRKETARRSVSVEILSAVAQLYQKLQ